MKKPRYIDIYIDDVHCQQGEEEEDVLMKRPRYIDVPGNKIAALRPMEMTPKLKRVLWAVMFEALTYGDHWSQTRLNGEKVHMELMALNEAGLIQRHDAGMIYTITEKGRAYL